MGSCSASGKNNIITQKNIYINRPESKVNYNENNNTKIVSQKPSNEKEINLIKFQEEEKKEKKKKNEEININDEINIEISEKDENKNRKIIENDDYSKIKEEKSLQEELLNSRFNIFNNYIKKNNIFSTFLSSFNFDSNFPKNSDLNCNNCSSVKSILSIK